MSDWISVDNRLPELGIQVMLFTDHGAVTGEIKQDDSGKVWAVGNTLINWDYEYAYYPSIIVSHWMPLPESP